MTLESGRSAGNGTNLRERKKAATRRALEEAALELFKEKGFAQTSVDEIAAAADVSRSTFFRYFGSKEAVFFADGDSLGAVFLDALMQRPAHEGPLVAYRAALIDLSKATGEDDGTRDRARIRQELIENDPTLSPRRAEELERWTTRIADAFARRGGRNAPDAEDRVAAAVCLAATTEIAETWRSLDSVSAADAIQAGFDRVRRLVADV